MLKIRAGTGLQTTLQTICLRKITELAKNSLQNGATFCDIDIVKLKMKHTLK